MNYSVANTTGKKAHSSALEEVWDVTAMTLIAALPALD